MEQNLAVCEFYLRSAWVHEREGRLDAAWACLEAVHILGQRGTRLHVAAHVAMLALAWRTGDRPELLGQGFRLLAAALATWLWVPSGNTGRSNVSPFKRLPLPMDLAEWSTRAQRRSSVGPSLR